MILWELSNKQITGSKSCGEMARFSVANTRITAALEVAPQAEFHPDPAVRPAAIKIPFCRLKGVIEKEIEFELWLPAPSAWNGKFLGAGVGGDAGTFNFNDLPRGVNRGYASGTTDTGHKADDQKWMMGDPIRLQNHTLRANHLLAQTSKRIVSAYYGRPARYEQVAKRIGSGKIASSMRLFMMPGVYHCGGGPGPDPAGGSGGDAPIVDSEHDFLSALEQWVEHGKTPDRIITSKVVDRKVVRTRPLCPYPQFARYKETGSTDDAANFVCVKE